MVTSHIDYWRQVADIARGLTDTTVYICFRPGLSKQFTVYYAFPSNSWAIAYVSCPDTPRLSRPPWLTRGYLQREWERQRQQRELESWVREACDIIKMTCRREVAKDLLLKCPVRSGESNG